MKYVYFKSGDFVRLRPDIQLWISHRYRDFKNCVGIVEGPVDYGSNIMFDVCWKPSRSRVSYHIDELVKLSEDEIATLEVVEG